MPSGRTTLYNVLDVLLLSQPMLIPRRKQARFVALDARCSNVSSVLARTSQGIKFRFNCSNQSFICRVIRTEHMLGKSNYERKRLIFCRSLSHCRHKDNLFQLMELAYEMRL